MPKTKSVSKTEFAKLIGVTPARVSQLLLHDTDTEIDWAGIAALAGEAADLPAWKAAYNAARERIAANPGGAAMIPWLPEDEAA